MINTRARFNHLTVTIYNQSTPPAPMCAGYFTGIHKMIESNTELFALRYACYKALDLLLDGDAEPADADAVIKLIENALNWKPS